MKPIKLFTAVLLISIAMSSCKSSINMIGYWTNREIPRPAEKRSLFIMALTPDINARNIIETDLKETAMANGFKATNSIAEMGAMQVGKDFPADAILKKVKELGYDAIFTVAIKDIKKQGHFVRASDNFYSPMASYGGYYGNFGSYFGNYYGTHYGNYSGNYMGGPGIMIGTSSYSPSYTYENTTYYLESNLYETSSQQLLLSIQTKAVDPPEITKSSKLYCKKLIDLLKSQAKLERKSGLN
jgi:hypothetical protein